LDTKANSSITTLTIRTHCHVASKAISTQNLVLEQDTLHDDIAEFSVSWRDHHIEKSLLLRQVINNAYNGMFEALEMGFDA
jgi:hypothetical protein